MVLDASACINMYCNIERNIMKNQASSPGFGIQWENLCVYVFYVLCSCIGYFFCVLEFICGQFLYGVKTYKKHVRYDIISISESSIHTYTILAPIVEHYSQEKLLLQRIILSLCCGEANAHHNTPKPFLSLSLSKILAPKSPFFEL